MNLERNNLFQLPPGALNEEAIETIIDGDNIKAERIISKGHTSPPTGWYDQDLNEWVTILQGEAIVSVEGDKDYHLVAGSHLNIPAHTRHRVKWTLPEVETIWLAVHY